jgi:hypothetical protein
LSGLVPRAFEVRQKAFGLLDQAGDQGHRGEVVAEPDPAAGGEGGQGVVDQVEGVITASRASATLSNPR